MPQAVTMCLTPEQASSLLRNYFAGEPRESSTERTPTPPPPATSEQRRPAEPPISSPVLTSSPDPGLAHQPPTTGPGRFHSPRRRPEEDTPPSRSLPLPDSQGIMPFPDFPSILTKPPQAPSAPTYFPGHGPTEVGQQVHSYERSVSSLLYIR